MFVFCLLLKFLENADTIQLINDMIYSTRNTLFQYGFEFLTAGTVRETYMNRMIGEFFRLCLFDPSEFNPIDIGGLNERSEAIPRLMPYDKWKIFNGNHHIDFHGDWNHNTVNHNQDELSFKIENDDEETNEFTPNEGYLQLMTSEYRPLFAMYSKTGGDYTALIQSIGQVILHNAYLANELVSKLNDENIINDVYYPGVLFFNPFVVFFETKFNWSYLSALTAANPCQHNLSKLTSQEFPETRIFSSRYHSSTAEMSLKYTREFNDKCKVQGYNLCTKEQLVQAVLMMRELTLGYKNAGKFDSTKELPPFEVFSIPLEESAQIDF